MTFPAEVLSQLRSLNWLTQEIRRVPAGSREAALLKSQAEAVRSRLPGSILDHHDRLAAGGKLTAAEVIKDVCGSCGTILPPELIDSIERPGRFGVCPTCGVFLWSAIKRPASPVTKRQVTKPSCD